MSRIRIRPFVAALIGGAAVICGDIGLDTITGSTDFSNTAAAQRGGRGGRGGMGMGGMREIRELLEPDFARRDVPLFAEQLQLDEGQRAIIESLIEDYADSFGEGSEMVQADLQDLGRAMMQSFMGGGGMGDMRERMRDRAQSVRDEIEEIQEANGQEMSQEERRDLWRERMQEAGQDMMQESVESGAMDEARGVMGEMLDILEEWVADRQRLKGEFVGNVEIQLSDDQLVLWPAFERFLVREKSLPRARLSGEGVNLFAVLDDAGLSDAAFDSVDAMLDEYEIQLHQALVNRDAYLLSSAPRLYKAMRDGDVDAATKVLKQQVQYREAVRNVNDNFRQQFADVITDENEKYMLNMAFLEEAYERIYRPTFGQRSFDAAREIEGLDTDVLEAVFTLEAAFLGELLAKNTSLVSALRKSEGDDQVSQGTRMVSMMSGDFSGGMPWGGGRRDRDEDDPYRDGMEDRERIDERYVEQLRALLTPEQQEALPTQGRGGRGGGGWGGGMSEEQRAEFMKRFDKDGDGELSDEERRSMIEEFRGGRGGGEGGRGGRGGEGGQGGRGGRGGEGGRGGGRGGQGGNG